MNIWKKIKSHLSDLTIKQRKKLDSKGYVLRWPGLTDKEAKERTKLIYERDLDETKRKRLQKLTKKLRKFSSDEESD